MNLLLLLLVALGSAPATDAPKNGVPLDDDTDAVGDTDAPAVEEEVTCSGDTGLAPLSASLEQAGAAANARSISDFRPAHSAAMRQVACLTTLVTPDVAAAVHAAHYLDVAISGDRDAMAVALLGATSVPGASPPEWLTVPEGAVMAEVRDPVAVRLPAYTVLYVNGLPMRSRPIDRYALYQAVGAGGVVLWSRWLAGDQPLPEGFTQAEPTDEPESDEPVDGAMSGAQVLDRVTTLLSAGRYQEALDLAIPAAVKYPKYEAGFRAAADLAADQLRRSNLSAADRGAYSPYAPRPRRGALKRGDDRQGFLFGFELGLPTALQGEWKIGRSAVDGVGLKIGGGLRMYGASSVYTGVDTAIYMDWNLTRRWQLQTTVLGVFFDSYGSPYPNFGLAAQYDPPNPLQVTVGMRIGTYGFVPQASVGFLW